MGETVLKAKPTRAEPKSDVGVGTTRFHPPSPLRTTPVESDSVKSMEGPKIQKSVGVAILEDVPWTAAPTKETAEREDDS